MSVTVVQQVKADLEARGVSLSGPYGAFAIASRVAWQLRDTGLGLNHQDQDRTHVSINGETYSPDFLLYQDGRAIDCLGDGGGANNPQWVEKTGDPARWRAPFNPDDGTIPPPPPDPPDVPTPAPCRFVACDLGPVLAELAALRAEVRQMRDALLACPAPPPMTFPTYRGQLSIPFVGARAIVLTPDEP